jgi:putative aminopeptidase FrvX
MTNILPFLKSLLSVSGLSAYEAPVARLIQEKWTPLVDEISHGRLASLHGFKRGNGAAPRPSVLLTAHMDSIGMMVSKIVDGFLYVTEIGGIDPRILPGTPVIVHATGSGEDLAGVVGMPPAELLPDGKAGQAIPLQYLLVDVGLPVRQVLKRVNVGDLVAFNTEPVDMPGEVVSGHSLDNRASVAALTICLEELQLKPHIWDVWAVASTQEELSYGGARTSTYQLKPAIAVVVDTTYGGGPGVQGWEIQPFGGGPTLAIGPSIHPFLHGRFREVADKSGIPYTLEPMPTASLTDADAIQVTSSGVPTMLISIPVRNLHTPVEMVSLKTIQRAGRLLADFVGSLEPDFIEKISWD